LQKLVESLARRDLNDATENVVTQRIFPDFARLMQQRQAAKTGDERSDRLIAPEGCSRAVKQMYRRIAKSGIGEIPHAIDETGRIAQQVADGHRAFGRFKVLPRKIHHDRIPGGRILLDDPHHTHELRQILRHGGVEFELAVIDQDHGGDAGDLLRHRADAKDRIRPHRNFLVVVRKADGLQISEFAAAGDRHDKTGGIAVFGLRLEPGGHAGQSPRRKACQVGIADGLQIVGKRRTR
jgi:hypothetical protein